MNFLSKFFMGSLKALILFFSIRFSYLSFFKDETILNKKAFKVKKTSLKNVSCLKIFFYIYG
jgi:hypothetical protein